MTQPVFLSQYRRYSRLSPILALLLISFNLFLSGCGVSSDTQDANSAGHLSLSASALTLLPRQTSTLTVKAENIPSSAIHLTLQCDAANCGSLGGNIYTAPSLEEAPLDVTVIADSTKATVPPSSVLLTIVPPPSITSITPNTVSANSTVTVTLKGSGFIPGSTVLITNNGGTLPEISDLHVLSHSLLSFNVGIDSNAVGVMKVRVRNQASSATSASIDIYVEPQSLQPGSGPSTFNVADYAASGSDQVYHCSGAAGSYTITCDEQSLDFSTDQGIRIVSAGRPEQNPAISQVPPVTQVRPASDGTHTYCYVVYATDALGGISQPSPHTCVSDGPLLSFTGAYNSFAQPYSIPLAAFLWYVSVDDGPYQLFSICHSDPAEDVGQRMGSRRGWPVSYPASSPGITKNEDLFTTVRSVSGSQITLQQPLVATVMDVEVDHDDTNAIQNAIDAAVSGGGGVVQLGDGHFNVRRPSFAYWTSRTDPYNYPTTEYRLKPSYEGYSNLIIPNGSRGDLLLEGNGPSTIIETSSDFAGYGTFISFGSYSSPAFVPFEAIGIENLDKGTTILTLADNAAIDALHPGDDVWLYSGSFSPNGSCTNVGNTAGGNCHFSELNSVASVDGHIVTLVYPTSKRFYDDGRNSFGVVKLPITPHNVGIQGLTIDTYNVVTASGYVYGLLINGVTVNGSPSHGAFMGGFKRDVLIENSSWGLGSGDATWNGVEEFDQYTNLALINDTIDGHSAPGSEGPSMGARLYFTEGTSQVLLMNNKFNHVSVYFQDSTDDQIDSNEFNDGDITVGDSYNPYKHPLFWGYPEDQSFISFGSQETSEVNGNHFNIDSEFNPPWIINLGHFDKGKVNNNVIYDNSPQKYLAAINSGGGEIRGNVITLGPMATSSWGIAVIPDEGPGVPPSGFDIEQNTITGAAAIAGIYVVNSGFTDTAAVCIMGNSIQIAKNSEMDVSSSSPNLSCDWVSQ